jgi:hypothetical protein
MKTSPKTPPTGFGPPLVLPKLTTPRSCRPIPPGASENARLTAHLAQEALYQERSEGSDQPKTFRDLEARPTAQLAEEADYQEHPKATNQPEIFVNVHAPWFYLDKGKKVQGPFLSEQMRHWLDAGFFDENQLVSQRSDGIGSFRPLCVVFPDGKSTAFKTPKERSKGFIRRAEVMNARQEARLGRAKEMFDENLEPFIPQKDQYMKTTFEKAREIARLEGELERLKAGYIARREECDAENTSTLHLGSSNGRKREREIEEAADECGGKSKRQAQETASEDESESNRKAQHEAALERQAGEAAEKYRSAKQRWENKPRSQEEKASGSVTPDGSSSPVMPSSEEGRTLESSPRPIRRGSFPGSSEAAGRAPAVVPLSVVRDALVGSPEEKTRLPKNVHQRGELGKLKTEFGRLQQLCFMQANLIEQRNYIQSLEKRLLTKQIKILRQQIGILQQQQKEPSVVDLTEGS